MNCWAYELRGLVLELVPNVNLIAEVAVPTGPCVIKVDGQTATDDNISIVTPEN